MKQNMVILIISLFILIFLGCENEREDDNNGIDITIDQNKPVILFSYVHDTISEIQLLNGDNTYNTHSDSRIRSNPCLSPDQSKIVYMQDYAVFPMGMGTIVENPSIYYFDIESGSDIKLLSAADGIIYYNPVWVTDNTLSVEKFTETKTSILIINMNGEIISEIDIDTEYTFNQYVSPDKKFIVLVIFDIVKVYDIEGNKIIDICNDVKYSSKPVFNGNKFYINTWDNCKFYDLELNNLDSLELPGDVCVLNDDIIVCEDNDLIKLLDRNLNAIDSVLIETCNFYGSLQTYRDSTFYFYGENDLIDDEGAVYKVDFNTLNIEKVTNLGEDHFIMYINSYD